MPNVRRAVAPVLVVATLALGANAGTYVVRPGDTLSAIAGRLGVSVGDLAGANGITDPNRVLVGQRLDVPGGGANQGVFALHVHDDGRGPALYCGGNFSTIGA